MAESNVTASQVIAGSASAFGVLSDLVDSRLQVKQLRADADETDFDADIARVNAKSNINNNLRELSGILASNSAALSTMGVDAGSGSALVIQQQSIANARRAEQDIKTDATIAEERLKRKAANLRRSARTIQKNAESRAKLGLVTAWMQGLSTGA